MFWKLEPRDVVETTYHVFMTGTGLRSSPRNLEQALHIEEDSNL